ncbi:MAG: ATP-dependent DNA helicase RecG [Anaerolineae bacterium]
MSSAYDKLRRILNLEKELHCRDRAVMGGLESFLSYWAQESRKENTDGNVSLPDVETVLSALKGYGALRSDERMKVIERLLLQLGTGPAETAVSNTAARLGNEVTATQVITPSVPASSPVIAEDAPASPQSPVTLELGAVPGLPAPKHLSPAIVPDRSSLQSPVTELRGISTITQERLERLGIREVRDLLYHFPFRYDDFTQLQRINRLALGAEVTVVGAVWQVKMSRMSGGRTVTRATVSDGTGSIEVSWFNQPYLERQLTRGTEIVLSGKVSEHLGRLVLVAPEWELLERELLNTGRLVPVYSLTEGIGMHWLRRLIKNVLDHWVPRMPDPLPDEIIRQYSLDTLGHALEQVHFPDNQAALERARQRLCFEEFLSLQLGMLRRRSSRLKQPGRVFVIPQSALDTLTNGLPYTLTGAQRRVSQEILADLTKTSPMSRLLQGEVGSGKTVVAVMAILAAVRNGLQAAIMAPTSILAEQHYRTISAMLADFHDIRCELLVGSLPQAEKERIQGQIAAGNVQVAIGTHALIQDQVEFPRLGLVVVDEQHRFGVAQRAMLRAKGAYFEPHLLAMSATPIPRSLALTLYGDLDVSVLDELPPNRQEIVTRVRDTATRERIYAFVAEQIKAGRQAFIICPLVEDSENSDAKAAISEQQRLQKQVFPHLSIGLLYGRMPVDEKDTVMAAFKNGLYNILVSTSVVEVGIDIPNASVIVVEGAEHFGLAQLHQFRGRVGRGQYKSYCILLSDDPSEESLARLRLLEETQDGFMLAQKDLEMRGPGDFFGTRQHGLPLFKIASLANLKVLEMARQAALAILEGDPELQLPEHQSLAVGMQRFWQDDILTH